MVTISTSKILLLIFALAFACAIIAIATESWVLQSSSANLQAYGAFLIIACISLGLVLLMELLLAFVSNLRDNGIMQIISILFMVIAGRLFWLLRCLTLVFHGFLFS